MHVLRSSDTAVVDNREDPDVSLGWQRQTEREQFGLLARYNESSTLSGTVLDTGVVTTDGTQSCIRWPATGARRLPNAAP